MVTVNHQCAICPGHPYGQNLVCLDLGLRLGLVTLGYFLVGARILQYYNIRRCSVRISQKINIAGGYTILKL